MIDARQAEFNNLYRSAVALAQEEKPVEAELAFVRAAAFAPEKWCDVATKLAKDGEEAMAIEHFRTALQITEHPGIRSGIFSNLAIIYLKRGQLNDGEAMLCESLRINPNSADALVNMGQLYKWRGNLAMSERYCNAALKLNPWHSEGQFLRALNALDQCDYAHGWPLYECRWRSKTNGYRKMECFQPEWAGPGSEFNGEMLKRLFVYCEQGAGDIFLMLRYAPLIRAAGMQQAWALKPGMAALVGDLVDACNDEGTAPDGFDCHVASASLPYIFKTRLETIPPCPYLRAPSPVDFGPGFHVGICWRGNTGQYNDAIRSTALADWLPVLDVPGVKFHSFQVDGADEALLYPQIQIHDRPKDWRETANRIAGMNLIITVDTGLLHLAGAMGLPVWCALHCRPYFVFPIKRPDTPWYPSVKLFKQIRAYYWKDVFCAISKELSRAIRA